MRKALLDFYYASPFFLLKKLKSPVKQEAKQYGNKCYKMLLSWYAYRTKNVTYPYPHSARIDF